MGSSERYKKYTPLEHILKRPDSYIGSIESQESLEWVLSEDKTSIVQELLQYRPGLFKIFDEVLVNAIDQNSQDHQMDTLKVNVGEEEGSISIYNTGKGIPIEIHKTEQIYIPEMIFGELLTSSNYNDEEKRTVGGRNGYGAKLTNIYSLKFEIEIVDVSSKQKYVQTWTNNMRNKTTPKITSCKNGKGYVKITFIPDLEKFEMTKLTKDIIKLFERRTYDACANTSDKVNVYYNETKLTYKTFEKYIDLYIGNKKNTQRVFDKSHRWEVGICHSPDGFKQVSFVNGISTSVGGSHVESVSSNITKKMTEMYKGKNVIKQGFLKDHMMIFVKSTLENPTFNTQTKVECTSKYSSFGSRFQITEDFMKKVMKLGIIEDALALTKHKEERDLSKTDGKKKTRIKGLPKLEDADKAGTSESENCTIIFTEGDSAKTFAVSGLSIVGRDKYGVFPLRGKLLNAREATTLQLLNNEEIKAIKQILGIQSGKEYTKASEFRYGRIMILTDADYDGSHIKGLLINVLHYLCPSMVNIEGMFTAMITPVLKITKGSQQHSFYTINEFETYKETNSLTGWKIKYYKGLGTSTSNEAKEYFKNMSKNLVEYEWDENSEESLLLAFKKENADRRKDWIINGIKNNEHLDFSVNKLLFQDFINKELILFSIADCERSIASMVDGFKRSQRKVLYSMRKKKEEMKVSQLAGYISSDTCYHHGEQSMMSTIINMAQDYMGSNNKNLLLPNGGFGTRLQGGKDAASPRYIFSKLSPYAEKVFNKNDDDILNYLEDDGTKIEPEYFVPTLPLVLINGTEGIGTGFSSYVPCYKEEDIKDYIKTKLNSIEPKSLKPWYNNFKGTIDSNEDNTMFTIKGVYKQINTTTVEITELPVGLWTQDYKEFLESITDTKIHSYKNQSTESTIKFTVRYFPDKIKDILKDLRLVKTIRTTNMHLFDKNGQMKKYSSPEEIINEFIDIRLEYYEKRKEYMLNKMKRNKSILKNKVKFVQQIVNDEIIVFKKSKKQITEMLKENSFSTVDRSYDYLLTMQKLLKEYEKTSNEIKDLETKTSNDLWNFDLYNK